MVTLDVNKYLQGNFAPVHEEMTVDELVVIGEIPFELSGIFVRNGPNPKFATTSNHQWFDGDGMLHGVFIHNGKASYRNRYIQTRALKMEMEAGKALWKGPMEPPNFDLPPITYLDPSKILQTLPSSGITDNFWHYGKEPNHTKFHYRT